MNRNRLIPFLLAAVIAAPAHAAVQLIADGSISGAYQDLSNKTAVSLESGAPGNRLGGLGSGLAYAGSDTFLALPDRGPNALPYDDLIDDTVSYIDRFQTFRLALAPSDPGSALPFVLTPTMRSTTLLSSFTPLVYGTGVGLGVGDGTPSLNKAHTHYFSGRSDNFDPEKPSGNPADGRFDPESLRVSNDGRSVFISDEYGPYLYQFDRTSGRRIRIFKLPDNLYVENPSPQGDVEIENNTSGRMANKGMEGLAITPNGKFLVGIMDFLPTATDTNGQIVDNPSHWFVIAFDDGDLPGYVPQRILPFYRSVRVGP